MTRMTSLKKSKTEALVAWFKFKYYFLLLAVMFLTVHCQSAPQAVLPTAQPTAVSPLNPLPTLTNSPTPSPTATSLTGLTPLPSPVPEITAVSNTPTPSPTPTLFEPAPANTQLQQLAAAQNANFTMVSLANSGYWHMPPDLVEHPIGIAKTEMDLYLLDRGRLIQFPLANPNGQTVLLGEDDLVDGVPVIELIDMTQTASALFLLDRAGDVYRYSFNDQQWRLDWYGRQREESSGHYYTAVTASPDNRLLLESSYQFVQRYGAVPRIWPIPDALGVDIVEAEATYVLQQALSTDEGFLFRYSDARTDTDFSLSVPLMKVRQLEVTQTAVFILDWQGERLLQLDKEGNLQTIYQTPNGTVSFFVEDDQIVFAGRQGLIWHNQEDILAFVERVIPPATTFLPVFSLPDTPFSLPITNTNLTKRVLQMPGAPRHYRLGVHEGLDFYWRTGTPLLAITDGVVVRVDLAYQEPSSADFAFWEEETARLGKTSDNALNFYRGRQVWIEHQDGIVVRYAHLSAIAPDIELGDAVQRGHIIGEIGNSGSPASINDPYADAHLHIEIWLDDLYLGQFLRPVESWELVKQIFGK